MKGPLILVRGEVADVTSVGMVVGEVLSLGLMGNLGLVRLVYKPLVLICTVDLLGEKNIVP